MLICGDLMTNELKQIAFNEGCQAAVDGVYPYDNPYDGVSYILSAYWDAGWWDIFYGDMQ